MTTGSKHGSGGFSGGLTGVSYGFGLVTEYTGMMYYTSCLTTGYSTRPVGLYFLALESGASSTTRLRRRGRVGSEGSGGRLLPGEILSETPKFVLNFGRFLSEVVLKSGDDLVGNGEGLLGTCDDLGILGILILFTVPRTPPYAVLGLYSAENHSRSQ